jgi:predicted DNA-binding transcriptional regulator YafY
MYEFVRTFLRTFRTYPKGTKVLYPTPVWRLPVRDPDHVEHDSAARFRTALLKSAHGEKIMIDYRDTLGIEMVRLVSVQEIRVTKTGVPLLICFCHARKEVRTFRIDRVCAVADGDGIVQEPMSAFWQRTFDITRPQSS